MKLKWDRLSASLLVLLFGAFSEQTGHAQADRDGIILDRQLIMQKLEKDAEQLGLIVAGIAKPGDLVARTSSIAQGAKEAFKSFEPKVPGGSAKPEIWTNWDDYSKRMQDFVTRTDELIKVAQAGNMLTVIATLETALPCTQCHDVYRVKKKP